MTASEALYALRHVDTAGTTHLWTCGPAWVHWTARWLARDADCPVTVLRDDGNGWVEVTVWTPVGEATNRAWITDGFDFDDQNLEPLDLDSVDPHNGGECDCTDPDYDYLPPDRPIRRPIIDHAVL